MKLHDSNARWERDFWADQHRDVAGSIRHAVRKSGDYRAPKYGRAARRYDLDQLKQMRGQRRAMGAK